MAALPHLRTTPTEPPRWDRVFETEWVLKGLLDLFFFSRQK